MKGTADERTSAIYRRPILPAVLSLGSLAHEINGLPTGISPNRDGEPAITP
jgi:hypothetical protein